MLGLRLIYVSKRGCQKGDISQRQFWKVHSTTKVFGFLSKFKRNIFLMVWFVILHQCFKRRAGTRHYIDQLQQSSMTHIRVPQWFNLIQSLCLTQNILVNWSSSLRWRRNGHDSVSNHQPRYCLLNRFFGCISKKHQSSASLAFVRGIHRGPVNSPHKWPVTRKIFPFDDVIMPSAAYMRQ